MPAQVTEELAGLYTSTYRKVKGVVVPQIFLATPALALMQSKGNVRMQTGGTKIVDDLDYEKNPSVQWIDQDTGAIDVTKHNPLTENQYDWKLIGGSIWAMHKTASQNAGPFRIFDVQKEFLRNVKSTMAQELEEMIFGAASSNTPYGLRDLVADAPATGTIGVINRATYSWFRNGYYDMKPGGVQEAFSAYGLIRMRTAFYTIQKLGDPRNLYIFTDMDTFSLYEVEVQEHYQITDRALGDLGFTHLTYKGRPMLWSPQCATGHMYFLDLAFVKLVINTLVNFDLGSFVPDQANINMVAHLLTQCQMTISRPKSAYVLFNCAAE